MKRLRVVFFGTPDFAVASLEALLAEPACEVVGVVTAPDRPAGRGHLPKASPVKEAALAHHLPLSQPDKLRDPGFLDALRAMRPDLNVVVAFRMLPELVWALPPRGSINLHASLLPDYRGAAPIHWAVMNGESETGLTTFQLAHEIDTGGILLAERVPIPPEATTGELYPTMQRAGAELLRRTVRGLAEGSLRPQPQDATRALHHAPKLTPDNTRLDWRRPAAELAPFVRGLSPLPTAWTTLDGKTVKLYFARADPADPAAADLPPGTLSVVGEVLRVATGRGWLLPTELQLEGRRRLPVADFLRGMPSLNGRQFL